MKTKRILKVIVTSLVCLALVVPVFRVAGAIVPVVTLAENPQLYNMLHSYAPTEIDPGGTGEIYYNELQSYTAGGSGIMNLWGDGLSDDQKLTSIEGLQYLTQITNLNLRHNRITDITPLHALQQLQQLNISYNSISDIAPLGTMANLHLLSVDNNLLTTLSSSVHMSSTGTNYLGVQNNYLTRAGLLPLTGDTTIDLVYAQGNFMDPSADLGGILAKPGAGIAHNDQIRLNVAWNGNSLGTPDSPGSAGHYYGSDISYVGVHDVTAGLTFMGWDLPGGGDLDFPCNTAPPPANITLAPPLPAGVSNVDFSAETADLTFNAVYAHSNADLDGPGNNRGTVVYNASTLHYDITLDPWDRNVTLHPDPVEAHATYTINGISAASKTFDCSPGIPVNVTIVVTAQDRIHTRTYTVTIRRTQPAYGKLAGFTFTPAGSVLSFKDSHGVSGFRPTALRYTLTLDEYTSAVTITPEKGYNADRVSPASRTVTLRHKGDSKTVSFTVRSGIDRRYATTYTIKVVRSKSATAALQYIKVSPPGGTVSGFSSSDYGPYTVALAWTRSAATVKAKAVEPGSKVYMGLSTSSLRRTTSRTFTLRRPGDVKDVIVRVVSPNGSTTHQYVVRLKRAPAPADATLSYIKVNGTPLSGFAPSMPDYALLAPANKSYATVKVAVNEPHATVKINGHRVKSYTVRGLVTGVPKRVTIQVRAADGVTVLTYHVDITRAWPTF